MCYLKYSQLIISSFYTKYIPTLLISICLWGCNNKPDRSPFSTDQVPNETPIPFKPDLTPSDKLIHKGTFSPDLQSYYYTLSDKGYQQFDTYVITRSGEQWTEPKPAFFNSEFSDHGMSFSPDGKTLFFSSTRPSNLEDVTDTWHIWKSEKVEGKWEDPTFVDIPNMSNKLVSHPTVSQSGSLYFHSSNPDYSEMDLYQSQLINGKYSPAKKVLIEWDQSLGKCTPHVSPDESYLLFAAIGDQLDLYVSFNDGKGNWTQTKKLSKTINQSGQGNPYVTPDHKYLFFTAVSNDQKWQVNWINITDELKPSQAQ